MQFIIAGFQGIFNEPIILVYLIFGIFLGMVMGAIPGLTASLAVTLMLPFTYSMTHTAGISLLVALYVGGISGGMISAILLNIPGTPSSLVTCFDGGPMAKNGKAGLALSLGVFASFVGGIVSAVALIFISPLMAKLALLFGTWEYAAMGIFGLCIVVSLTGEDTAKGLIAAIAGVILKMVGIDSLSNVPRFTFGAWQLSAGLSLLACLMGLFAMTEILMQVRDLQEVSTIRESGKVPMFPGREVLKGTGKVFASSALIGVGVGILPGVGQTTSTLLAYTYNKNTSKHPEMYGTGCAEGVIASETANNATCGGALIPMLCLGVPGDTVTAILMGAFIVHGITPGPLLFTRNVDLVGVVFIGYLLCNIIMYVMEWGLMKGFINLLKIPMNYLYPIVLLMCIIGTYSTNNRVFDCGVFLAVGVLGYVLRKNKIPLAPIVLGYVLGDTVETNLRTAIVSTQGNILPWFSRPISVAFLIAGVVMLCLPLLRSYKKNRKAA